MVVGTGATSRVPIATVVAMHPDKLDDYTDIDNRVPGDTTTKDERYVAACRFMRSVADGLRTPWGGCDGRRFCKDAAEEMDVFADQWSSLRAWTGQSGPIIHQSLAPPVPPYLLHSCCLHPYLHPSTPAM